VTEDNALSTSAPSSSFFRAIANLAIFHREHEKYYSVTPREQAVVLQRHARTLQALSDRWSHMQPVAHGATFSPFQGTEDLNDNVATQLDGVLFMEGDEEPPEIAHIRAELRSIAADSTATGEWLTSAMQATWDSAAGLLTIEELADQLGERHRIIANDWQAAAMSALVGRILSRAVDMIELVDFTSSALRADIAGQRVDPKRLYSAAELIAHAADLLSDSAGLVHDNERRWRMFRAQVEQAVCSSPKVDK
jgi:hypothetical protein